nr:hypothetical protein [Tanacetum cinerariifolium]
MDDSETTQKVNDVTVIDRAFFHGDYVAAASNPTGIDDVLDNVTVMFDDGSVCKVMKADPLLLKKVRKNLQEDAHYPYYPGQRVKASSSSVFKNSRWLFASAGYGLDSLITPSEEQNPKNLNLLACFSHAHWQLGYWCLLSTPTPLCNVSKGKNTLEKSESDTEMGPEEESTNKSDPLVEPSSCSSSLQKGPSHETWPLHQKKVRKVVVKEYYKR